MRKLTFCILIFFAAICGNGYSQLVIPGVIASSRQVATSSLLNGLVSFWKFNDTASPADDAADSNDGTVTNAVVNQSTAVLGKSFYFDGTGDYVDMGNPSNLSLTTAGSVSLWVYPTTLTGDHVLYCKGNFGNDLNGYWFWQTGAYLSSEIANASAHLSCSTAGASFTINAWNHVVIMWDADSMYQVLNGTRYQKVNTMGAVVSNVYNARIGTNSAGTVGTIGYIDEPGVWNRKLTRPEITTLRTGTGNSRTHPFIP